MVAARIVVARNARAIVEASILALANVYFGLAVDAAVAERTQTDHLLGFGIEYAR